MDNVTHTLIGIATAHVLAGRLTSQAKRGSNKKAPKSLHSNFWTTDKSVIWTAVIGNNIPDLDFLMQPFLTDQKLGYLLNHRGYTHTILLAIPLGILSAYLGSKLGKKKFSFKSPLLAFGVLSVFLHIAADFFNNYGVHPLSPFMNRWFYGDTIFIIEPILLATLIPMVFFSFHSKWLKGVFVFLAVVLVTLIWMTGLIHWSITLTLFAIGALTVYFQYRLPRNVLPTFFTAMICYLVFGIGSFLSYSSIYRLMQRDGHSQIQQLATSPSPSNPFCWSFLSLHFENSSEYVIQTGVLSLAPALFSTKQCSLRLPTDRVTPLTPVRTSQSDQIVWTGEFRRPLQEFLKLREENCRFRSLLRFARMPVWHQVDGRFMAQDLRFDHGKRGFSLVDLDPSLPCLDQSVPWEPPTGS